MSEPEKSIDPSKTALLLLHWQKDLAAPGFVHSSELVERLAQGRVIEHTRDVLEASRKNGVTVIYVNGSHRPGYPEVPGTHAPIFEVVASRKALLRGGEGVEIIEELKPLDDEIIVNNYNISSFCFTELDLILRNKGITDIVLSGLITNWIVETTARHGACLGYYVYTLQDCCTSLSDEMHDWPMKNILPALGAVIDSGDYITALEKRTA